MCVHIAELVEMLGVNRTFSVHAATVVSFGTFLAVVCTTLWFCYANFGGTMCCCEVDPLQKCQGIIMLLQTKICGC